MFVTINNTIPDSAGIEENNAEKNNGVKKRRGRPPGSKNRTKPVEISYNMDLQESLPDIPEHGSMRERNKVAEIPEANIVTNNEVPGISFIGMPTI